MEYRRLIKATPSNADDEMKVGVTFHPLFRFLSKCRTFFVSEARKRRFLSFDVRALDRKRINNGKEKKEVKDLKKASY